MTKRGSDSLCGAQTAGFSIQVQKPCSREKSRPLVKGWGVRCLRLLETIIPAISPHAPSWCRLPWKTEYCVSGAGVRVRLSLTPIKSIRLDLGSLDLATQLHEEDT